MVLAIFEFIDLLQKESSLEKKKEKYPKIKR